MQEYDQISYILGDSIARKWLKNQCKAQLDELRKIERRRAKSRIELVCIDEHAAFLDTETTGLDEKAEVVEISILDYEGNPLLDTLIKPVDPIPQEATKVHGITDEMVKDAPTILDVLPTIIEINQNYNWIIYNADYDVRVIMQSIQKRLFDNVFCAMTAYSDYHGEWNPKYNNYKWQSLENAAKQLNVDIDAILGELHRAKKDVLVTIEVCKKIAEV